jgi:hypothetical protein
VAERLALRVRGRTAAQGQSGCDHADCVMPLCRIHHRNSDTGRPDLPRHLEPRWRQEIAHVVCHPGLINA